jgi:hypothetical protein
MLILKEMFWRRARPSTPLLYENLKCVRKILIIKEILVEVAGVELSGGLGNT